MKKKHERRKFFWYQHKRIMRMKKKRIYFSLSLDINIWIKINIWAWRIEFHLYIHNAHHRANQTAENIIFRGWKKTYFCFPSVILIYHGHLNQLSVLYDILVHTYIIL